VDIYVSVVCETRPRWGQVWGKVSIPDGFGGGGGAGYSEAGTGPSMLKPAPFPCLRRGGVELC